MQHSNQDEASLRCEGGNMVAGKPTIGRWARHAVAMALGWMIVVSPSRAQDLPVAGLEVPALAAFDSTMQSYMQAEDISAGVAAIMKDGKLVYRRAFGWDNAAHTVPVEEDAMMRLASVTKPLTAGAIRQLISDGQIGLNQRVFSLDEPGSGILDHLPFDNPNFDQRLKDITVNHLLQHRAGWDRGQVGDWSFEEREIAFDMGVPSPPGRDATLSWILGNDAGLQFSPGTSTVYSNIGYMVLGMVVESVTGQPHMDAVHDLVFSPLGVPEEMVIQGRTFEQDHDPREPHYDSNSTSQNVFWNLGNGQPFTVNSPYGGWDHEALVGHGGMVADPIALLEFMQEHQIAGNNIGGPRPGPGGWTWAHTGRLPGTSTIALQRGDGTDFVILFNKADTVDDASALFTQIINSGSIDWPTIDIRDYPIGLEGDLNGDGRLNGRDIQRFLAFWLLDTSTYIGQERYTHGDMNFDGLVDISDWGLLRDAFSSAGLQFSSYVNVPEPDSLLQIVVLVSMLSFVGFYQRRLGGRLRISGQMGAKC